MLWNFCSIFYVFQCIRTFRRTPVKHPVTWFFRNINNNRHISPNLHKTVINYNTTIQQSIGENRTKISLVLFEFFAYRAYRQTGRRGGRLCFIICIDNSYYYYKWKTVFLFLYFLYRVIYYSLTWENIIDKMYPIKSIYLCSDMWVSSMNKWMP